MSGFLYVCTAMVVILLVGTVLVEILTAVIKHLCRVSPRVRRYFNGFRYQ